MAASASGPLGSAPATSGSPSCHSPPLVRLCPSPTPTPHLFHSSISPLVNRSLTKCFPSLPANFSPLSELFPLVNSFLARGGQPSSGASEHRAGAGGVGRWMGTGEPEKNPATRARPGLWGLLSALRTGGGISSKMLIQSPFQFVQPLL